MTTHILYYLVRHRGTPQEHRVTAPIHESAIHSYLDSYKAHHDELTVFSTLDYNEGMNVKDWLEENLPSNRCPECLGKYDSFLGLCDCPVNLADPYTTQP